MLFSSSAGVIIILEMFLFYSSINTKNGLVIDDEDFDLVFEMVVYRFRLYNVSYHSDRTANLGYLCLDFVCCCSLLVFGCCLCRARVVPYLSTNL